MNVSQQILLTLVIFSVTGCGFLSSQKDDSASVLNPRKIHSAYDSNSQAFKAGQYPVSDYYAALELARTKYLKQDGTLADSPAISDHEKIVRYIGEGIGLVDSYCLRWFQGLDDTSRLLAYQNKNVNIITQLGTALFGIGGASSAVITGYGAGTTAYAGLSENFNSAFLVAPTASKVKDHIGSVMASEAKKLREEASGLDFKQAYARLENYADLCTHARAKEIVDTALGLTKTEVNNNTKMVETTAK